MPTPSHSERDHQKIGETILLCVRSLLAQSGGFGAARVLVLGALHEIAERMVAEALEAQDDRVQYLRAFGCEEDFRLWGSRFAPAFPKVKPRLLRLEEDVLAQGFSIGQSDFIAVVEAPDSPESGVGLLINLKRLLKRGGLLLLEVGIGTAGDWKQALARAGFEGVMARSDRVTDQAGSTSDLLIARSDGRVQIVSSANVEPPTPGHSLQNGSNIAGNRPFQAPSAVQPDRLRVESVGSPGSILSREAVRERVIALLERMLQLSRADIDTSSAFIEFGVDSIVGVRFVNELKQQLRIELKATVLFDYGSVEKLATFIAEECQPSLTEITRGAVYSEPRVTDSFGREEITSGSIPVSSPSHESAPAPPSLAPGPRVRESDVAIIGISGRFPDADNVEAFWRNLAAGKDCIGEIPPERWDHSLVYDPGSRQVNKTNSKWGGFLTDADKFDPLFFNISGREAEATDPQHRLFLEECYHAIEDAGYAGFSANLARKCGVFAGVEPGDYLHLLMDWGEQSENSPVFQGNAESILAARISYFLDLKGPSIAVNTACSSSLVAIHLACQSLLNSECDLALAGGVRVFSSAQAYLALGNMGMLSPEGQCKTFDESANGFVPGEAVGVLVLKPLSAAVRDGDHLYGIIKGSAINQDGRTNGITAPSSLSQAQVELEVYDKFGLRPETFQYVEAHGTGTKLGDPIEIEALTQSFRRYTAAKSFCAIGSVKTNIGHTMAAAGVCSIIKVLLALQHRLIPPSLNLQKANSYIDFENSPFFVNTILRAWSAMPDRPRRAAISSFGFSGTNGHLVIEEAPERSANPRSEVMAGVSQKPAYLVTLSAKTPEALQQSLRSLIDWLRIRGDSVELEELSFTLNVGRGHFEHRCAIVTNSIGELNETLLRLVKGEKTPFAWRSDGRKSDSGEVAIFRQVTALVLKELPEALRQGESVYREKLAALAALYAKSYDLDVIALHHGEAHRRISLPTYPFARERYWVPALPGTGRRKDHLGVHHLHPLVHRNVSTLTQTKFESYFDGQEFFFDDHRIRGEKILPGVAYFEMAAAAVRMVMEGASFGLINIAWMRPLPADQAQKVTIRLVRDREEDVRFEILSGDQETLHAQGRAVRNRPPETRRRDLAAIRARCPKMESSDAIYGRCAEAGLELGAGFRTIRGGVWFGENEALARLELPAALGSMAQEFVLHPGLLDGALQTTAVLGRGKAVGLPVPFAVAEVLFHGVGKDCYAHVRRGVEEHGLIRFDISLLDESGDVLAELKGLTMRLLPPSATPVEHELIFVRPTWIEKPLTLAEAGQLTGRLILFDPEELLADEISRRSPALHILRVIPGSNYSVQGNVVGLRPDCPEDFDQLLQLGRPDFVIHRWSALANETIAPTEGSILPLFQLTRALICRGEHAPTNLLLVYPPGADPAYPAVAGYARTLRQERPNLRLKVLETGQSETSALVAELLDSRRDQEIRVRDGRREVKRLETFVPEKTPSIPLRERGVYVITGGLGGLGCIFARYLAKQCHARLVLIGRSKQERWPVLTELEALGAEVLYLPADVSRSEEVVTAIREVRLRFGGLHGVIHAAGVIRDGFVLNKSADGFSAVIAPKAGGAVSLDEATRAEALDFFVLFSSMAGVFGNVGQSDYAYANCFLDEFAWLREERRARGERSGRTVSINWPLWRNGGMRQTADFERLKLTEIGLAALEDEVGLAIFEVALQCSEPQLMGLVGQPDKIRSLIASTEEQPGDVSEGRARLRVSPSTGAAVFRDESAEARVGPLKASAPQRGFADLRESVLGYLTRQFSTLVKIAAARILPDDPLEKYGIDSIMVMEFTQRLEKDFGELSKTLLFEHQTLAELVDYFLANHRDRLGELLDFPPPKPIAEAQPLAVAPSTSIEEFRSPRPISRPEQADDIAIIGLSGRYPMADDLEQFWENLRTGKDCIIEIPKERWDYRLFYDPEPGKPGKTPNKWGGFLNDVERFDAAFFNITPREAFALDPQERLFLETVWRTVEDAGYRKSVLANRKIGVFVGVMYGEYQLYGAGDLAEGKVFPLSSSYASIANRVSYIFNWRGPSMAIDTMCSSSLTAIHLACESLRRGESELAIGGGVNATLHPHKDLLLSPGGFAASDGRCRSFGEGGDGYVPGEGVGAVLLKPLARAVADGDHVYAVVRASSVNHGGKTNGYTVPNPKAQAELISEALRQGNVPPRTVNYIEAHGTGTALGDPIEIAGLSKAFDEAEAGFGRHSIAVGSVKSNIGHLESAAGIAGVTKILLQMRHGQIAPSLHSQKLNPHINFANSAFYVPQTLQEWKPAGVDRGVPIRRAGISSFGAGGANAHLILEEFVSDHPEVPVARAADGPFLFILSAKTEDRLRARAEQLLRYLQQPELGLAALADIAYTLQIGREPLGERLALVANDVPEASLRLRQFLAGELTAELQRGSVQVNGSETEQLLDGEEGRAFLDALIRQRKWQKLAHFWVSGGQVEWEELHHGQRRIPLPTYPFAGARYWAPDKLAVTPEKQETLPATSSEALFLRPVWKEKAAPVLAIGSLKGRLLLFDPDTALANDIEARHPLLSVTRVVPGDRFAQENGFVQIDPRADEDYARLLEIVSPDFILYRWVSVALPLEEMLPLDRNLEPKTSSLFHCQLESALELGIFSLFHLTRKLVQRKLQSEVRLLFCHPANATPAFMAIGAFAKALAQEQPKLQLRVLQTNDADADLLTEFFSRQNEREIIRQNGRRQCRTFEPVLPKADGQIVLREEGVYLLTGGFGGIGRLLANYLAGQYRARLVLTGRSAVSDEIRAKIADIEEKGGQVLYLSGDIARMEDAREIVRSARQRFGPLNGVIHAAGILHDSFLLKKEFSDFVQVLRPKVHGVAALDEAASDESLDFFALFSSTAGAFGNAGQSDYAYANGFLDAFASAREVRRSAGERYGKTVSINWPLWKDGGMSIAGPDIEARLAQIGLHPLSSTTGIALFETALRQEEPQLVALWGNRSILTRTFLDAPDTAVVNDPELAAFVDESVLSQELETYLKGILAEVTQLPVTEIDSDERFEEFGIDSIVVTDFNFRLEKGLGPLPKTLLFEYPNFRELTRHLVAAFKPQLDRFFGNASLPSLPESARRNSATVQTNWNVLNPRAPTDPDHLRLRTGEDIAIIGLAGRYPKANDLRAFWEILKSGTDCVTEIPKDRWDNDQFYDADPNKAPEGKIYARWGAFVDGVDRFDPLFFNIAPVEAELMDPQERLFLETAWTVLEDAGYTRGDLARWARKEYATNVGVFVGVTTNTYSFVARDNSGERAMPTTLPWSLANRVSYLFNFNGPSLPVDTACSSSLTAIHLACEAIRAGQCQQAIAGGVNLYLHPSKYVSLCMTRMLSTDGKCRAFGEGGDGFVPGEGVGAILLKPLSLALADGDHVYGLIKGTAVNHGGRTNGYTVPNPAAQADLIVQALQQSGIDPRTLSYLEAHGTGTALGDPIEIAGLAKAFAATATETVSEGICSVGSVKTNIGHLEAAAGIAGITKVLLQMKHRQLAPSLHADQLNSNITFEGTPFRVQRRLEEWRVAGIDSSPRRAGISSFGAGGANAFVVIEEFIPRPNRAKGRMLSDSPVLIVLSARNSDRLQRLAKNLEEFLAQSTDAETPLPSIASTLQIGREALEERVAFVVRSRTDLLSELGRISRGEFEGLNRGHVKRERMPVAAEAGGLKADPTVVEALSHHDLERLARLWVGGVPVNWRDLSTGEDPGRRVSLPGYPFSRERYWVPLFATAEAEKDLAPTRLHPLLHRNKSTLHIHKYESYLASGEVVLRDHQVSGRKVLPGAASLELALAGVSQALGNPDVQLRQVVWMRPLVAGTDGLKIELLLWLEGDGRVSFELKGPSGDPHVQGKAEVTAGLSEETADLSAIRNRCSETIAPDALYPAFADRGLGYGAGFRVIEEINYSDREVLSVVQVPQEWGADQYRLHPALADGALQSLAVIGAGSDGVELPFAVDKVECGESLPSRCYVHGRVESEEDGLRRYELKLLNEHGKVLARLCGLSVRTLERPQEELLYYGPVWKPEPIKVESAINGPILVLDEGTDLAEALERQSVSTVRVLAGDAYRRDGNVITIRTKQPEDYERLAQEVAFSAVIHRRSKHGSHLEEALECGLYSVHRLAQALIKSAKTVPWVYAYPRDEAAYEAIGGYAKTLRQEQPRLRLKTVGMDNNMPADLLAELSDGQFEVRYREGQREVRALEKLPAPTGARESPCKRQGVYLLSGGVGGLGRIFAEHLVQMYDARLLLIGRSELSESSHQELEKFGDQVLYLRADVSRLEGAIQAVQVAKQRYGGLNGVIHAAGELRDGLIRNKTLADIEAVLAAKVWGAEYLDAATRDEPLDFFILFSSLAGLLGNAGQSDYAYANAYLDSFAQRREELHRAGLRSGRTLSLNWPLWRKGGMQAGDGMVRFQVQELGLRPLETKEGLAAFTQAISSGQNQCAVFCGAPQKLLGRLKKGSADLHQERQPALQSSSRELKALLFGDVKRLVAKVLRLDVEVIEPDADTSEYGFDSITFTALANELNAAFGLEVTPAVLFEYRTLETFIDFLCREHGDKLAARYAPKENSSNSSSSPSGVFQRQGPPGPSPVTDPPVTKSSRSIEITPSDPIAIVGMSGVFPGSPDLDAFWQNLDRGKDLIARAPNERWSFAAGSPIPGSTAGQMEAPWGGFIADPDKFDPLFFDISPREAELMDPQQRLFLQTVWHALEDAGYRKSDLAGTKTGLFAGVAANDYANLLAIHGVAVEAYSSTGNAHSVLANRVSYFFDLRGPSEAIDTACSSSLVAIHRAIESIASGSSEMAIVGGVNVLLSPGAFLAFGKAGMLCPDGRCKTFDARANGYVRGEGVGAILLKPLSRARRDGDHIYAVIIGSGENHGGRVQSLTVPNPNAQAQLLQDIYARAGIDPYTISYIEAHGTGTSLGDPIEINGLKKAFGLNPGQVREPLCAVGSVKTNIGHLETAAGIAGVIKTLLAIHHRRIPGNVHLQQINPYIQIEGTPFCFPTCSVPWEPLRDREDRKIPRRAGVSSFGFGGANAHLLLEEYFDQVDILEPENQLDRPELFLFSARDPARLKEVVTNFHTYLGRLTEAATEGPSPDLRRTAYTLQVGREPMDERLAVIASTASELVGELARYLRNERSDLFSGNVADHKAGLRLLRQVHEDDNFLAPLLERRQLLKLARLWVSGLEVPWGELWTGSPVRRVSLPGYPFERLRYWIPAVAKQEELEVAAEVRLHPLLHSNESTLKVQRYRSQLSGEETVLRDHRVGGEKVFPGAAGLELALSGVSRALENPNVRLRQVVWARPVVAGPEGVALKLELRPESDGRVSFELQSQKGETHLQGKAESTAGPSREPLDLKAIRARCSQTISSPDLYARFAERGLDYGPGFRVIVEMSYGSEEVLSALEVPSDWGEANYRLHPALVDGALQSLAVVRDDRGGGLELPFAVNEVECREVLPKRCYAYGRIESDQGGVRRYEVKLLGEGGEVLAHLGGLAMRPFGRSVRELLYYRPLWTPETLPYADAAPSAGTMLLLDETPQLQETLAACGISTIRVIPGSVYQQNGNHISIRRESAEDYARLVREIEFTGVIHRWSREGVTLDEALERGLYSLHKLTQALLKGGKARQLVYVYPADEVAYEAVAGYAKSLRQEQPNFRLKTVGVESQIPDLLPELGSHRLEVCYRAGRREVRTLDELPDRPVTDIPLRQGGVYLMSGGAGGLGRIFAEYLVRKYDARLVLAGRSELIEARREELALLGDHAVYVRTDISAMEGAVYVVGQAKQRYGTLNGVIHAAAELRDGLIWNKTSADFAAVLAAKVRGVEALDAATSQDPLDCFVLFSSIAALFGNAGQSDYAYANAYLDAFAHRREKMRRAGQRFGRTLSLNWPLWRDGGLQGKLGDGRTEALGLVPLERDPGLQIFEAALTSGEAQVWGCVGSRDKVRKLLVESSPRIGQERSTRPPPPSDAGAKVGTDNSEPELTNYLIQQFASLTRMEPRQIRPAEPLEKYGFDSIMAVEFSQQLERDFGDLSKTLLFEYPTLEALAGYFRDNHPAQLAVLWQRHLPDNPPTITSQIDQGVKGSEAKSSARFLPFFEPQSTDEDVAIVGVFGRYPQADNLDEFWTNLVEGKDCIEEIPLGRWDYRLYFDPQPGAPGRSYNKWGGFLRDVDKFDPLFFNISPREAEMIDPQERLFLETVWKTVEDAGYSRRALSGRKIGVFVGVMYGQYQLFGVEESLRRGEVTTLSSSYASIANRVSYFFDWRGPSVAVDTMCSSSLMSIHLACESLKRGESQLAIAGGVNLILHPHKDVGLSQAGFLNKEGRCRSFGKTDGRGYVPGEGVGSVLLKPLTAAIRERDHIHGVIKATVVNHNGKTNGYAMPNPNAQAELIAEGFKKAGIDPRTIRYVEAAATGSALGDPLEISGLTKAFQQATKDRQFCAIGSVKSNGGHLESASGIAGLTKTLLQLSHRQLVPSVHTQELNPDIRWEETPFFVQRQLADWQPTIVDGLTHLRRAGVNAFGAGGSNAHLIVEEYPEVREEPNEAPLQTPFLIVLSAKDHRRLVERASDLADHLRARIKGEVSRPRMLDLAYTLQLGREPMESRLAFLADRLETVIEKLTLFAAEVTEISGLYRGSTSEEEQTDHAPRSDDFPEAIQKDDLNGLAAWWIHGGEPDWESLYVGREPRRISLPTYRFARERCWFRDGASDTNGNAGILQKKRSDQGREMVGENGLESRFLSEVRQLLGAALKLSPERIGLRQRLVECGLDSVTTVAFLKELERRYDIQVSAGRLSEYPTLESFVSFLLEHHSEVLPSDARSLAFGVQRSAFTNGDSTDRKKMAPELIDRKAALRMMALAPLDYLFVGPRRFAIQVLYYFEPHLDFARLQAGLGSVAEVFYPINSHLVRHREEYFICECSDEPDFVEICDVRARLPEQDRPETFAPFQVPFDPLQAGEKLAKFRLFQLAGGSLLSANVSHAVADGYSFYYFLSSWAAACRGESFSPPDHSRRLPNRLGRHSRIELAKEDLSGVSEIDFSFSFLETGIEPTTRRVETLRFDGASLLAEARDAADEATRQKITENGLLTALVWQAYARALTGEPRELVLACPIDFRRLSSDLSPSFFGNASAPALLRLEREQVLTESVPRLAALISDTIRSCDERTLARYQASIDDLRSAQGLDATARVALVDPRNGLIVTNVARFPLPAIDFGTGSVKGEFTPVNYAGTGVIVNDTGSTVKVRLSLPELVTH